LGWAAAAIYSPAFGVGVSGKIAREPGASAKTEYFSNPQNPLEAIDSMPNNLNARDHAFYAFSITESV
jgi:hypothetical protein